MRLLWGTNMPDGRLEISQYNVRNIDWMCQIMLDNRRFGMRTLALILEE
jgi:hypothetical protein